MLQRPKFLRVPRYRTPRAGIVASKRGPQGGYSLAGEPDTIRLGDVIRALEGPLVLSDGSEPGEGEVVKVTEAVFRDLSERVESCFDGVTLADICSEPQPLLPNSIAHLVFPPSGAFLVASHG